MTARAIRRSAILGALLMALIQTVEAQGPPEGIAPAVASLVQFAYGERLGPREMQSLRLAVDDEWNRRPESRNDLAALVDSVQRLAGSGSADSAGAQDTVRQALETSGERDPGPLGAWLRSFRACLEPLDLPGDEPITGRRVLDLLWAAARLQAAGFGVSIALEEPVSPERLMVAGRRILEMPDGERLLARSARLAATVAGQFDSPNGPADPPWAAAARQAAGLLDLELPLQVALGGREPTGSSAAWRPAGVPGAQVTLWMPADWTAEVVRDAAGQRQDGYLILRGPGGSGADGALSEAIRVFVGPPPERAAPGAGTLEAEVRSRVEDSGAEVVLAASSPYGSAFSAGFSDDELIFYALDVGGGRVIAARGVWPLGEFHAESCYTLFHRVWMSRQATDAPAPRVGIDGALSALAAMPPLERLGRLAAPESGDGWLVTR